MYYKKRSAKIKSFFNCASALIRNNDMQIDVITSAVSQCFCAVHICCVKKIIFKNVVTVKMVSR